MTCYFFQAPKLILLTSRMQFLPCRNPVPNLNVGSFNG